MKKFILKFLIFIFPIIIIAILFEVSLRVIPNSYLSKKNYLDKHSKEIEILILGSSHASMGLDPSYFDFVCYNAAMTSQSIDIDYEILKKFEGKWDSLKYVVIPIDYFTLTSRLENGAESWRIKDYIIYYDLPIYAGIENKFEITSRPIKTNLKRLISYYYKHKSELYYTQFGNEDFTIKPRKHEYIISGRHAAKRHTALNYFYFDKNLTVLSEIGSFCTKNNVNLILYTSPGYYTYTSLLDSIQLNKTIEGINKFSKKSPNFFYYNLLNDSLFNRNDFFDGDHLNESGAKKLSLIINGKVLANIKSRRQNRVVSSRLDIQMGVKNKLKASK